MNPPESELQSAVPRRQQISANRLPWLLCWIVFACGCAVGDAAQLIPVARTFGSAWQNSGYPGAIPSPTTIVNVRNFGATGDGVTDDRASISTAIASLGGAAGVAYFPAGNYRLLSTLTVPGGCVLRGERPSNTTLTVEHIGAGIRISRAQSGVFQPVVSGYTIHSNSIVVTTGSTFVAGDYAEIREDNDVAWGASTWAPKVVGQILRITAVAGNTLTLERPLRITYLAAQNPEIRKVTPITEAGIENLKVSRVTVGTATDRDNKNTIDFNYAARCWVRGVELNNGFGGHVGIAYSTKVSVTGCYIHHAAEYDGGGSGYGARLEFKTGECLIENNTFRSLRHAMLLQAGVNGNVFGYNYSREQQRTEFPSEVSGDVVLHGNYPFSNLFEGNICQHIWPDNSHNANGPLNTFFRNRSETYGINVTDPAISQLNVVGNETYTGTWSAFIGDGYALQGANRFEYGNNTQSDGVQAPGTTSLTDYSYYLNNDPGTLPPTPAWWNIAGPFPPIGLPLARTATKEIPARARYFAGTVFTVGPPSLALQPVAKSIAAGTAASFTVQAAGTPVALFAWRKNGVPLAGQTGATLTIAVAQPADAGSYDCVISDSYGSVTSAAATLAVSDNFAAWAARNGVAGATVDFDFDGLQNLIEYALGLDPKSPGLAGAPVSGTNGGRLTLTYTKVKNAPDVACAVQVTSSLAGTWSAAAADVDQLWQVIDNGATQTITARDKTPFAGLPGRFIRLRVTAP